MALQCVPFQNENVPVVYTIFKKFTIFFKVQESFGYPFWKIDFWWGKVEIKHEDTESIERKTGEEEEKNRLLASVS